MGRVGSSRRQTLLWSAVAVLILAGLRSFNRSQTGRSGAVIFADGSALTEFDDKKPRASWKTLFTAVYENLGKHRVVALAAGVTFYSILALFPAMAALVSLYGLFADPAVISTHLANMSAVLPGGAIQVIDNELHRLISQGTGRLGVTFLIGLGAALWSANAGMKSLMDALNVVYGVPEQRGLIKLNAVSIGFTGGLIGFALLGLVGLVVLPIILDYTGIDFDPLLKIARWPALLVVAALGLALLYRFGPSRHMAHWKWISWGSAFAVVAWLIASVLFTWYAANFGSYNKTYGSLGAVIGFMIWIWISAIAVLIGAEIDAHLEHSTRRRVGRNPIRPA